MTLRPPITAESVLPWEKSHELETGDASLPTVSIVIPIFNAGRFLEKTIRSLLCNHLNGVEVILMDGGSTDNTMDVVEYYADMFTHIQSARDKGQSDAINQGFEKATGDIYYWLNGDDILLPNTLNIVRKKFAQDKNSHVWVGNAYMTELDFSPINHFVFSPGKLSFEYLLDYAEHHLVQPSVFFSRQAWEASGPLNIEDHYSMDADLFIGMARKFEFRHLNVDVAYSVYHEDCKTRGARAESITSLALVQAKHGGLKEAARTLGILVEMYNEAESQSKSRPEDLAKIHALDSKLKIAEELAQRRADLMLKVDLEQGG